MRTTLNLSDALMEAAKQRATTEGRTLTSFIEEALRRQLEGAQAEPPRPMPTFGEPGRSGLRVDILDRDALEAAFDEPDEAS